MKHIMKLGGTFLALAMLVLVGCDNPQTTTPTTVSIDPAAAPAASKVILCGACGNETGTDVCCAEGAETCGDCGLHKGSALCCNVPEDMKGKDMCTACGHANGSEECCADGCETCDHCGMHEGAPLCCKLPHGEDGHTHDEETAETSAEEPAGEPAEPAAEEEPAAEVSEDESDS